jgi:probable phosphoglycerate mutase
LTHTDLTTRGGAQRVFFVRHGETIWSLAHRHTGVTDIPLTPHGERQARALKVWFDRLSLPHVWTSPRLRARKTCDLAGCAAEAQIDPDLAEWDYGDYEGLRSTEICARRHGWRLFGDGCPNGETPSEIAARIHRVITRVRALGEDVALFSHGQFGAAFAARWIGLPVLEAQHLALGPASISVLSFDPDHPEVPVIALWNVAPAGLGGGDLKEVAAATPALARRETLPAVGAPAPRVL